MLTLLRGSLSVLISLIVAVAENGVIGAKGGLPWRMSSDLKTFRRLTMGKPIVMGRRTFQSIGKPLDGRDNIVITRDPHFAAEGVTVFNNLGEALILARALARTNGTDEVMIIGGAELYRAALDQADRIYWTAIEARPDGDTVFPALEASQWREVSSEVLPRGPKDEFAATLKVLDRIKQSAP
jgi:dihydrofolate reductase